MAQANERKGVLHHLRIDRLVAALASEERTFDGEDSSEPADASGRPTEGRRDAAADGSTAGRRILTPEERIVELVAQHGGRMKQGEVVSNIEWSESTVSRKLQRLESTGEVTRYQLGREKLVYLPGQEPAALGSPFAGDEENAPVVE
jgi:hypothetical protein